MKLIPYIRVVIGWGMVNYKPLKPTGRWKLESGPYYVNRLFVEHRYGLYITWISELDIVFKPETTEVIFECNS